MCELRLAGLIGAPRAELLERLGTPAAERRVGGDTWLVFRPRVGELRLRSAGGGSAGGSDEDAGPRVVSWTLRFRRPAATLREAARRVGLWPEVAPDATATEGKRLLRRPLPGHGGAVHSFTATLRGDGIVGVAAFDEPPEW